MVHPDLVWKDEDGRLRCHVCLDLVKRKTFNIPFVGKQEYFECLGCETAYSEDGV